MRFPLLVEDTHKSSSSLASVSNRWGACVFVGGRDEINQIHAGDTAIFFEAILAAEELASNMCRISLLLLYNRSEQIRRSWHFVNRDKDVKFCSEHKRDGMVDLKSKRCLHHGCSKVPS